MLSNVIDNVAPDSEITRSLRIYIEKLPPEGT